MHPWPSHRSKALRKGSADPEKSTGLKSSTAAYCSNELVLTKAHTADTVQRSEMECHDTSVPKGHPQMRHHRRYDRRTTSNNTDHQPSSRHELIRSPRTYVPYNESFMARARRHPLKFTPRLS